MNKAIFIFISLLFVVFLIGCQKSIVCNKPYIEVGNRCCLDQNSNKICDYEDSELYKQEQEQKQQERQLEEKKHTEMIDNFETNMYLVMNKLDSLNKKQNKKEVDTFLGLEPFKCVDKTAGTIYAHNSMNGYECQYKVPIAMDQYYYLNVNYDPDEPHQLYSRTYVFWS